MDCEQYQEYISQFIDGELEINGEADLFRHLSACEQCCTFLKETMSLRSELLSNQTVAVPESLDRQIIADMKSTTQKIFPITRLVRLFRDNRTLSLRVVKLALVLSLFANVIISILWHNAVTKENPTIVCLTPLPEVEVNGYVVIAQSPTKGIKQ